MEKETLYTKACNKEYFEKYAKNGNLLRTAEKIGTVWIVSEYPESKTNLSGEYTEKEFKAIKRYFK